MDDGLRSAVDGQRPSHSVHPQSERFPLLNFKMSLIENAPERPHGNLVFPGHNHGIHDRLRLPDKLHVAALLTGFYKACSMQAALHFTERLGLKPPQPQPRSAGPAVGGSLVVVRNRVPELP